MKTCIVAIGNQKGGVGKTTTAVNLAACLAELGRKVLLLDLDPQANATSGLGLAKTPGQSIYSALLGERPVEELIQRTEVERLDLLPSEIDLAGAEVEIARGDHYLHRLRNLLQPIRHGGRYEFVLVDCSPSLGILTMNVLAAVDSLIVPIQCEFYALEGLSVISRLVAQLRESGTNPELELEGIVMTMYDGRTNLSQQVVQEVSTHFPTKVYETLIPRNIRLGEAPSFGKPITLYNPFCTGAVAYRLLAKEFLARRRGGEGEDPAKPLALGRALAGLSVKDSTPYPLNTHV